MALPTITITINYKVSGNLRGNYTVTATLVWLITNATSVILNGKNVGISGTKKYSSAFRTQRYVCDPPILDIFLATNLNGTVSKTVTTRICTPFK